MTHVMTKKKHIPCPKGRQQPGCVCLKWCEDEIAIWKVRRTSYVLGKELGKIHMQRRGKMGSGARPEGIPGGRRDVTR